MAKAAKKPAGRPRKAVVSSEGQRTRDYRARKAVGELKGQKGRGGRPKLFHAGRVEVTVVFDAGMIKSVDDWRSELPGEVNRSAAIRELVKRGLGV